MSAAPNHDPTKWPFIHRRLLLATRIWIGHPNRSHSTFKASSTALGKQIAGPVE